MRLIIWKMKMNKYIELSDFEINELVSFNLGYVHTKSFDPCNNPSHAMPIIKECGISLIYQDRQFQFATNDGNIECCIANPLKAAMIIFLCIKDSENENNNNS